jgi:hypothetical protein
MPLSDQDYEWLCYVRKSGDYPTEGTEAWAAWNALTRRCAWVDRSWTREHIAWHEAGHALVGHRLGGHVVNITARATHMDNTGYPTVSHEVWATITVAGHVAEEMVVLGRVDPSCNEASRIAWQFRKLRQKNDGETPTPQECRAYVEAAESRARAICEEHRSVLEVIARRHLSAGSVNRDELLIMLAGVPNGDLT